VTTPSATSPAPRGLDHLVVGVRDLDRAAASFEALGFQVGARNRHPWGTHNRLIQFPGSFIELITVAEPSLIVPHGTGRFSFGAFVRDALDRAEGVFMLVLDSADAVADAAAFAEAGLGRFEPFFFERQGLRPDGTPLRVAFTLAFAATPDAPLCGFFVCQQHEPQSFWNPAFQRHRNGALGLGAVTLRAPDPAPLSPFIEAFSGAAPRRVQHGEVEHALARGSVRIMAADVPSPCFGGAEVNVPDLAAISALAAAAGLPHEATNVSVIIAPEALCGLELRFLAPPET
jgi:catechol 2,3-dioxygenase-like lactoylglutathione lyase family enzyme